MRLTADDVGRFEAPETIAEDAVQETFRRWQAADDRAVKAVLTGRLTDPAPPRRGGAGSRRPCRQGAGLVQEAKWKIGAVGKRDLRIT